MIYHNRLLKEYETKSSTMIELRKAFTSGDFSNKEIVMQAMSLHLTAIGFYIIDNEHIKETIGEHICRFIYGNYDRIEYLKKNNLLIYDPRKIR